MTTNALAASTHCLIPLQLEVKIHTAAELVAWCLRTSRQLRLSPTPTVLGLVPSMYDKTAALHRDCMEQLPAIAEQIGVKLYEPIPNRKTLKNAAVEGKSLRLHRPGDKACEYFAAIARDIQHVAEQHDA